jgi:hypothetical protein
MERRRGGGETYVLAAWDLAHPIPILSTPVAYLAIN